MNTLQSSCTSKLCVLTNALHGDSLRTRMAAVPALVAFGNGAVESLCYKLLNDDDPEVRWRVERVFGLLRVQDDECFDALLDRLAYDDDDLGRDGAAWALGEIGDTRAIEPLLAALNDDNEQTAVLSAYALEKLGADGLATLQSVADEPYEESKRHRRNAVLAALAWARIKAEVMIE